MGSWAAFANRMHPMPRPLIAGFVQGVLSGCLTLFLKFVWKPKDEWKMLGKNKDVRFWQSPWEAP